MDEYPSHYDQALGPVAETAVRGMGGIRERAFGVLVSTAFRVQQHREDVLRRWPELSSVARVGHRLGALVTSAAGFAVVMSSARATGVAVSGFEWAGFNMPTHVGTHDLAAAHEMPAVNRPAHIVSGIHENFSASDNKVPLPVSEDQHAVGELPSYNKATGDGTVWNLTKDYLAELGYPRVDGHELHVVVGHTLRLNGITWEGAAGLPIGKRITMPTPHQVDGYMHEFGIKRTHEPVFPGREAPEAANPAPPGSPRPSETLAPTPSATSAPSRAIPTPSITPAPGVTEPAQSGGWIDATHVLLTGATLTAVGLALGAGYYIERRRAAAAAAPPIAPSPVITPIGPMVMQPQTASPNIVGDQDDKDDEDEEGDGGGDADQDDDRRRQGGDGSSGQP